MTRFLFAVLVAALACLTGSSGAPAQHSVDDKNRWMIVKNESDLVAANIFIVRSIRRNDAGKSSYWSRDLLEDKDIDKGRSAPVDFDDGSEDCVFDVRIVSDVRDKEWNLYNVDVCGRKGAGRTIVLKKERVGIVQADNKSRRVKVENKSGQLALFMHSIPSRLDCCWSHDLFGLDTIPAGSDLVVDFNVGTKECLFDVRVESGSEPSWNFDSVNVCDAPSSLVLQDPKASDGKVRLVQVDNQSSLNALYVYGIPAAKNCCWSEDLLGAAIIPAGKIHPVDFDLGSGDCLLDVRVLSNVSEKEWNFDRVDICAEGKLTLK